MNRNFGRDLTQQNNLGEQSIARQRQGEKEQKLRAQTLLGVKYSDDLISSYISGLKLDREFRLNTSEYLKSILDQLEQHGITVDQCVLKLQNLEIE